MYNARAMAQLVGKTVTSVELNASKDYLRLRTAEGAALEFFAEGDCCSHSWIENMENVASLLGGTVTDAEDVDVGDTIVEDEHSVYIKRYGVKLYVTGRPPFLLEFRNSSNGYYGGSLEITDIPKDEVMISVREDF